MSYKKVKFLFLISLVSFATSFGTAFIGAYSFSLKTILGTCIYFALTYVICTKYRDKRNIVFIIILIPSLIVLFLINILSFKEGWVSLPSNAFLMLGILTGFIYSKNKRIVNIIALTLLIGGWELIGQKTFTNKMLYGSYNQKTISNFPSIKLADSSNFILNANETDKIILLDFWNTGCGVCFSLFPYIDSVNKKIDTNKYDIRLVNIPMNGQTRENNFSRLNEFPFKIKQLFANDKSIADSFNIVAYPTTLIIKNNMVVFRGEFENAIEEMTKL